MKAIILAAGEGKRMRPLTLENPKPLLRVAGKCLLEHIVSCLPEEVEELIFVVGYLGEKIINYCGSHFLGRNVTYLWQEKPEGNYAALKLAEPLIKEKEKFFVLYADDFQDKRAIRELLSYPRGLLVKEVEDPRAFGVVVLNPDKTVKTLIEKPIEPISNLASTGVFLLDKKIFSYSPPLHPIKREYFLSEAIAQMVQAGEKIFAITTQFWVPIATPFDLEKAEMILKEKKLWKN